MSSAPAPVSLDAERCVRCGRCAAVCPHRLFSRRGDEVPASTPDQARLCIRCGHCVAVCPAEAVRHADLEPEDFPPAPAPPDFQQVLGLLRARRSVRCYEPRSVAEETVSRLLQAARYSPTGHNACCVGCTAVLDADDIAALRSEIVGFYRRVAGLVGNPVGRFLAGLTVGRSRARELAEALPGLARAERRLAAGDDPLFHKAPALLLFHAPAGQETSETDCALAAGQVTLLAPSLGLGTCHIGYASAALKRLGRLARRHGVPRGRRVYCVLTLGQPALDYPRLVPRPALEAARA